MWAAAEGLPTREEWDAALLERIGPALWERFQRATVAVCGLGGLGSHIAVSLARAGVGRLHLIDFDRVDLTNLNRQQYTVEQLGQYKASQIGWEKPLALAENLKEINPYLGLECHTLRLTPENIPSLLQKADVICEAFDKAEEKAMLVNTVLEQLPQATVVAASGMAGLGTGNSIRTWKVGKRLYLCGDGKSDVEDAGSLFAPRVMLCAAHQALAVLRVLAGEPDV